MNKRIYKYQLKTTDDQVVDLPIGSEILTVQVQSNHPCLWALVDPEEKAGKERHIEIYGTGHDIGYDIGIDRKYIATYQLFDGGLVFHVFERIN